MNSADPRRAAETANFYDINAGPVYGYCLSLCADSEIAVNAFHWAMIRAWASGGGRVRAFALVRAECRMRGLRTPTPAIDENDRDARAIAPVFTRLPSRDAEAAELTLRFGLGETELAGVFGLPVEHAQRLVHDARALFLEALTAESLVGVSEGVLSELVRSAHPLARIGGLMPPVEPPAEIRASVLADLLRFAPEECCAHRHGPGVTHPFLGRTGPGPSRARRLVGRSAVLACSMLVAVGFVTGLSRPSGVESVWAPPSRPVAGPPRLLPPASVEPSPYKPAHPHAPHTAAHHAHRVRPARPHGGSAPHRHATAPRPDLAPRRYLRGRSTTTRPGWDGYLGGRYPERRDRYGDRHWPAYGGSYDGSRDGRHDWPGGDRRDGGSRDAGPYGGGRSYRGGSYGDGGFGGHVGGGLHR